MPGHQHLIEFLPVGDPLGSTEEVGDPHVGQVPALFEQRDVGIGEGAPKNSPRQAQGRPGFG